MDFSIIYVIISLVATFFYMLFCFGNEIYRANYARKLKQIQKYMEKVPLKPYLNNAYVKCLLIKSHLSTTVYIKECDKNNRLIVLRENFDVDDGHEIIRRSQWLDLANYETENVEDLIIADWAIIQRMFSPKTTFKDIHKLVRRRNYYTMYANGELPENPYIQQKQSPIPEVVEEKSIPVEDFQSLISPQESAPKHYNNDERRVDL